MKVGRSMPDEGTQQYLTSCIPGLFVETRVPLFLVPVNCRSLTTDRKDEWNSAIYPR